MTKAEIEMAARIREQIFKTYPLAKRQAMTPTPAQIEAARRAIELYMPWDLRERLDGPMNAMAIAALTAAAEVGKPDPTIWISTEAMNSERNATIERCAQEIEGRYFKHINDAVAAIRALKDKRHTICNSDAAEDDDL